MPEFRHALTRRVRREKITVSDAQEIWETFGDWPLDYYEIGPLVPWAAEMSAETGCTVYDAIFVALAESEGIVVITADGKLLRALAGTPFEAFTHPLSAAGEILSRP